MNPPINYLAVLVSVVASVVLGSLWYGPIFGKMWMQLRGITMGTMDAAMKKSVMLSYLGMMIGSLVMVYVLAHSLVFASTYTQTSGVAAGFMVGVWTWIGFVAPVKMGDQLWLNKSWNIFFVEAGYYLVQLCMVGVILSLWV